MDRTKRQHRQLKEKKVNMNKKNIKREMIIPANSAVAKDYYENFLKQSYDLFVQHSQYITPDEDINSLELAHLIPEVKETVLAIYLGINDAICNKGLITPFLVRHGHNNVFAFDPQVYPGSENVPSGTIDAEEVLNGFEPPNETWNSNWTYVMIEDLKRTFRSLWQEKGYIDMIPAKFEDFIVLSDFEKSKACIFIAPKAFEHPVNSSRVYLKKARELGERIADEFEIPQQLRGEFEGLEPVVLQKGEKLYVACADFGPCAHGWTNIHPDNKEPAVINENSAVPLDLVIAKPPVKKKYSSGLIAARGSADMTTDWFYRGRQIVRTPLLKGLFKG
jgi:hypothetical protein